MININFITKHFRLNNGSGQRWRASKYDIIHDNKRLIRVDRRSNELWQMSHFFLIDAFPYLSIIYLFYLFDRCPCPWSLCPIQMFIEDDIPQSSDAPSFLWP